MKISFLGALQDLEKEKGIDKEVLIEAIEIALITGYKKNFNQASNVNVSIDRATGVVRVYSRKKVVEEVADHNTEISIDIAREKNSIYELGDVVELEVTPRDFGRIAAQTAKQVVTQRIREAERGVIYDMYIDSVGNVITGKILRKDARNVYIEISKTEAVLPTAEQIPGEQYYPNERIKVFVSRVDKTSKGPQVITSRTHAGLLRKLFELEVPEIKDGIVEIKSVAREAGQRSKIAVLSHNNEVDPVGACVGPKGMRVQAIVNELRNEKIDIVRWSDDFAVYVSNSLSPSKVLFVSINEMDKSALVVVPDYQLSLAIGKEGQNARLAAKLTNWKIDIKSESQYNLAVAEGKIKAVELIDIEETSEEFEDSYNE